MNKLIKYSLLLLFTLGGVNIYAQKSVTIAFDPLTTVALGGYEVEAGFNFNKNRITVSHLSGDLSPWFGQAEDFKSTSHGVFEVAYNRFLNDNQKGFSYGLAYAYFTEFSVENTVGQSMEKNPSKLSIKLAYAWYPFKSIGLYLEPIMTFGFMLNDENLNFISGETFEKKSFIGNGPLFNLGYKFNF